MNNFPFHTIALTNIRFLVTGGAGFIGSHLVEYLLQHGAQKVRVLDNFATGFQKNIDLFKSNPAFELIEGDIRNPDTCLQACQGIDIVLHQAALGSVPRSIQDPQTTNEVNIVGFLNMLVAAKDAGVKRFVYAASSSTYGDSKNLPKKEDIIGKPLSPYAVTKYVNELYADVFARTYGLETIGLRYFNVFGPRQSPKGAYAAVIPLFIKCLIDGQPPQINGDGSHTRDFTFIENVVQANIKAALVENKQAVNQVYNIAYGERTSLNQLVEMLRTNLRADVHPIHRQERVGDIRDSLADITKAKQLLGYCPSVSVAQGLRLTALWFKQNQTFINQ